MRKTITRVTAFMMLIVCFTAMSMIAPEKVFITDAIQGGMAEITLGELAQQKSNNADIKRFGSMLVADHTKANELLKQIAIGRGYNVPEGITREQQKAYDKLNAEQDVTTFDREFLKQMLLDHRETIKMFEHQLKTGKELKIKEFITNTLPSLQEHLKTAQSLAERTRAGT